MTAGIMEQLEIDAQYAGYLDRQDADIVAFRRDEGLVLPADLDYRAVSGLSTEAAIKLERIRPATLGQAARIDGVTPAALTLVLAAIRSRAAACQTRFLRSSGRPSCRPSAVFHVKHWRG